MPRTVGLLRKCGHLVLHFGAYTFNLNFDLKLAEATILGERANPESVHYTALVFEMFMIFSKSYDLS